MPVRLINGGWDHELSEAVIEDSSALRIVCPFIKEGAIRSLLQHNPRNIQVITRFSLSDFATGVSDTKALRMLLDANARVRGVRNLHAKLYLFGRSKGIITSCNLTEAALRRNHEFGMIADDATVIDACLKYFDDLWEKGKELVLSELDEWNGTVAHYRMQGGRPNLTSSLPDFGFYAGIVAAPPVSVPMAVTDAPKAFVKLLGQSHDRAPRSRSTISEIQGGECHWAVCYPYNKRPRSVTDNALIFMGRLTHDPNDIRVFGRAIGMAYVRGRDDATPADIERRSWKEKWPHYIRVYDAEFVDGTLENGVSLYEMMNELEAHSFASTKRNDERRQGNINPRRAYNQRPHVELSAEGLSWLNAKLQASFETHGRVSIDILKDLEWPDLSMFSVPTQ